MRKFFPCLGKLGGKKMSISNGNTPYYNLRAVVTQTGLNPATIRAWERRYGLPSPERTDGGHRQYSQRDIDTLKWLIARQDEGISISHAIQMWRAFVERGEDPLLGLVGEPAVSQPEIVSSLAGSQIAEMRQAWIDACLDFDRVTAEQVLASAFAQYNPETVCIEVLLKGISEIGRGWYDGRITIQQEHFASALSVQRLDMLIAAAAPPTRKERIVVATAPHDYHVLSPLLITYLLRRRGWDVVYLGANVPADEMEDTILQLQPSLVIISAQLLQTAASLKDIAVLLHEHEVPMAFGGSIFNHMPDVCRLIPGHYLGGSLEEAVCNAAELAGRSSAADKLWSDPAEAYEGTLLQFQVRRAAIESHVWEVFIRNNQPKKDLADINKDIAGTIEAALILGDINLLPKDINYIEYLLMGYRLPSFVIGAYIAAYYEAAQMYLGEECSAIVDWLAKLAGEKMEMAVER